MHYGIFHFFVELLITFFVCKNLEKMIGTLLTFSIILIMMIMTSFLYFLTIFTFKLIVLIFNMNSNFDFMYDCGMSSLLFSLYKYINQFKKNKDKFIKLLNLVAIKSRFSPFYILIVLTFFTPNKTFLGNLCGIISAYIIKSLFGYHVLPKYEGINDFEKFFKLNYCKCCYISIIEMNEDMKNNVMEIYTIININPTTNKQEDIIVLSTDTFYSPSDIDKDTYTNNSEIVDSESANENNTSINEQTESPNYFSNTTYLIYPSDIDIDININSTNLEIIESESTNETNNDKDTPTDKQEDNSYSSSQSFYLEYPSDTDINKDENPTNSEIAESESQKEENKNTEPISEHQETTSIAKSTTHITNRVEHFFLNYLLSKFV